MSDLHPITERPTNKDLLEWIAGLLIATGDLADIVTAVRIKRVAETGTGTIEIAEQRLGLLLESLRTVAEDPDLYFVDPPGKLFGPEKRHFADHVLQMFGADVLRPAHLMADIRRDVRAATREACQ